MIGRAALLVALAAAIAPAQEAVAPKLGADPPPPAASDPAPAQRLPAVVTICADRAARRCWTVAGRDCGAPGERVVTVPAGAPETGARLRACWDAVTAGR